MGTPAVPNFVVAGGCVVSTSHVISPQTMGARRTERWAASLGAWRPGDVAAARRLYRDIRRARTEDPRSRATAPADVSSDNPLQATEDSGWGEYFRTSEVRDTIALDLERLHPGDEFYSAPDVQQALLNLLLVWSLENPRLGYRQGMHELASLVFSQRAKDAASRDTGGHRWGHSPAAPSMDATADDEAGLTSAPELSASHVEHDAYAMFAALMGADRDDGCRRRIRMASFFEDPPGKGAKSGVQTTCDRVYARLEKIDPALRRHLDEVGIEPQLFLLRWLRVLFSREFHLHDAMVIWDAVIATNDPNDPNDEAGALVGDEPSSAMSGIDYANPGAMDFIESFAVAMLLFVRSDVLALDDFGSCLRRLQKFPPCEDVAALVERARTASFGKVDADEWIPKPHPAPPSSAARRDADDAKRRLFESESEWAEEMSALKSALGAVRDAFEAGEGDAREGERAPPPPSDRKGKSPVSSLAPSPGTPPRGGGGAEKGVSVSASARAEGAEQVAVLSKELDTRARVFEDDADFIVEVKEGSSAADLDPDFELKSLGLRFENWKRDFKERLKETRVMLRRLDEATREAKAGAGKEAREGDEDADEGIPRGRAPAGEEEYERVDRRDAAEEREKKKGRGWGLKRALGLKR